MAASSPKHLLPTQQPLSVLLAIISFFLLLLNKVNSSDSLSFSFSSFGAAVSDIIFQGDALLSNGTLQLTSTDASGNPLQNSAGRALFYAPVHLWEESTGRNASFYTSFSFVINPGADSEADGLTFFIAPPDSTIPSDSAGGYLALFNPDAALNTSLNQIVAVEFDTYTNNWDPNPGTVYPHIGVDINTIVSTTTVGWQINEVPSGSVAHARIFYDSVTQTLAVSLTYPNVTDSGVTVLSQVVDLRAVLPEWVRVGFSAATGGAVETHNVLSWTFASNLQNNSAKKRIAHSAI